MELAEFSARRYRDHARVAVMLLVFVAIAAWRCDVSVGDLVRGIGKGLEMRSYFFPPDWKSFPLMLVPALQTVLIAAVATPIGAALSIVCGLAGARNIAPPWLRLTTRSLIALERGIPEIVITLILVAAFGIGALAGVAALAIGSIGMLGKLLGDAIEEIDPRTVDAVSCVGATKAQVIRYAVLPQVMPSFVANSLFRFDVNVRSSVLLGAVGAGGIGYELTVAMTQFEYSKATVAVFLSLVLVFAAERGSDVLRSRLLSREGAR